MALRDLEDFLRERAAQFDPTLDTGPGSPFDTQVIQPVLRRQGTDPFTVDLITFLDARLKQAFPELATRSGDGVVDLLMKPAALLMDPLVRETTRVKRNLSFKDPDSLTLEEAESLGANLFAERATGQYATGPARIFFSQPQNASVTAANYATSRGGLRFFPTSVQAIRVEEMALNQASDGSYYFDVNLRAEEPGEQYNIGINELVSIANVPAVVRVTNLRRFRYGEPEDSAPEFVEKAKTQLTEQSLVTLRGVAAKLTKSFPELRRLNVVGYADPEMQRDVITGGGLGEVLEAGIGGMAVDDGENQAGTRRFAIDDAIDVGVSFSSLISSSTSPATSFVLTLVEGFYSTADAPIRDLNVLRVIDEHTIELEDQDLLIGATDLRWAIRKKELTLSGIPGGILFPTSAAGTLEIVDGEVHIGGATDIHVSGTEFQEASLVLDNVTDDEVELAGTEAQLLTGLTNGVVTFDGVELDDFVLGTDYSVNDDTYLLFARAQRRNLALQLVTGEAGHNPDNLGVYRVVRVLQQSGQPAKLQLEPTPPFLDDGFNYRWRLFDQINVELTDPKETRVTGYDLEAVQNSSLVQATSGTNFTDLGVSEGDILRILSDLNNGDYSVESVVGNTQIQLDRILTNTAGSLHYTIFRRNDAGAIELPLIRVSQIELLDSSQQPLGSYVPYAKPIDIQSRAFQNPGRGLKHSLVDCQLGIISQQAVGGNFSGLNLTSVTVRVHFPDGTYADQLASFTADTLAHAIAQLNGAIDAATSSTLNAVFAFDSEHFAIRPVKAGVEIYGGTGLNPLFGTTEPRTSYDIRSASVLTGGGWDALSPAVDYSSGLDVAQVISGNQIGYYSAPYSGPLSSTGGQYTGGGATPTDALIIRDMTVPSGRSTRQFAPEQNVRLQLGSRSLGSARCYFLEPTTIEFDEDTLFSVETDAGEIRFLPDPTLNYQIIPPLPSDNKSNDGETKEDAPDQYTFKSASQDFLLSGVSVDDLLVIDYVPLRGNIDHTGPVVTGLSAQPSHATPSERPAKYLTFSIDNGPDITVTFIKDDVSLNEGEVTVQGVLDQINAKAGRDIAQYTNDKLEFEADALIIIRATGTANPVLLGSRDGVVVAQDFSTFDRDNQSPHAGSYKITVVNSTELTFTPAVGSASPFSSTAWIERQGYRIYRTGVQRVSTTQMAAQEAEAGLFYADVELVSEGAGDLWNIPADIQLLAEGYYSDGYYLETADENMAFSMLEEPRLILSKSILEDGVDDDPNNATQIAGQNIQLSYERSQLVQDCQSFVRAQTERTTAESILVRHLIPNFVRFDMDYAGGSSESIVIPLLERYIRDLKPVFPLESSRLQDIVNRAGATSLTNPVVLLAIIHNVDRSIWANRSEDFVTAGRLSAYFPDVLNVVRSTG